MVSILKTESEIRVLSLCEKYLEPQGFRAVDVDCQLAGRSLIRIFIERMKAKETESPGTSIQDCAEASRLIGPLIETENVIPGAFDLEVSSPGIERRLRLVPDFEGSVGEEIKLKLVEKLEALGGANVTGKLARVQGDMITLLVQGKEIPVPLSKIKRANRVWNFEMRK